MVVIFHNMILVSSYYLFLLQPILSIVKLIFIQADTHTCNGNDNHDNHTNNYRQLQQR